LEIKVHVNNIHGSQMAAKIIGKFTIDGHSFRFNAIAFGRIGGQNVGVKISKATIKELKKLGYDANEVIITIQNNLLQGNLTIPKGIKKDTFVDD